jgi:hypothetical protein
VVVPFEALDDNLLDVHGRGRRAVGAQQQRTYLFNFFPMGTRCAHGRRVVAMLDYVWGGGDVGMVLERKSQLVNFPVY